MSVAVGRGNKRVARPERKALPRPLTMSLRATGGDAQMLAFMAWHGKGGETMLSDTNLAFAWFGFIFLMLLFKAPFAARLIGSNLSRGVLHAQLMHRRGSAGGHGVRGPGSAHPQVQA